MKEYIDAKCNVFTEYMTVPDDLMSEFESLCADMRALGERCTDYYQFEEQFAATGLSDRYNGLLARCTPKPVTMTPEQKKAAARAAAEQVSAKDILRDAADMAVTDLKQEAISRKRQTMIDNGTFDEYTRTTNKIDDAARAGKVLLGILRKK